MDDDKLRVVCLCADWCGVCRDYRATFSDAAASFRDCQGYNNCPIIKDGRIYPCAYVAFADVFSERFDVSGLEVGDRDSISIDSAQDSDAIMSFLSNPVPWCRHCDMASREFYSWEPEAKE